MKVRVDERGRVTIPSSIREHLRIAPNTELFLEERGPALVLTKQLSPEEFIEEAKRLQEEIMASKFETAEPLKIKDIWKGKPEE